MDTAAAGVVAINLCHRQLAQLDRLHNIVHSYILVLDKCTRTSFCKVSTFVQTVCVACILYVTSWSCRDVK